MNDEFVKHKNIPIDNALPKNWKQKDKTKARTSVEKKENVNHLGLSRQHKPCACFSC